MSFFVPTGDIVSRSKAHTKFAKTVHRAWLMANLRNGLIENQITVGDGDISDYDDLGRASVVLTVAAMDSYFTDAFIEKLIRFLRSKKPTKDLIKKLEDAGFGLAAALELLNEKHPYGRIKRTLENHLERYVTQSERRLIRSARPCRGGRRYRSLTSGWFSPIPRKPVSHRN
jgi:hypothetical protein